VRFLADEGVDAAIVVSLRSLGHDVAYIAELSPGMGDDELLERARTHSIPAEEIGSADPYEQARQART
jgi:hypothetical protein